MSNQWQYQLRIYLTDEFSGVARSDPDNSPSLRPLMQILEKHSAILQCQFDAFAGYVAEAEKHGTESYPLYEWTKATIENPTKQEKYLKAFSIRIRGQEVYSKQDADALESDLEPLVGGTLITRMSKHDTNPENNPQPPARYRR